MTLRPAASRSRLPPWHPLSLCRALDLSESTRRFVEAWKAANELKELKAYRDALEGQVLPALDAYVKAAEAMPTGSPELAEIHKGLVDAYLQAHPEAAPFLCHRFYDLSKLAALGAHMPATPLAEGLRRQVAWLDEQA